LLISATPNDYLNVAAIKIPALKNTGPFIPLWLLPPFAPTAASVERAGYLGQAERRLFAINWILCYNVQWKNKIKSATAGFIILLPNDF